MCYNKHMSLNQDFVIWQSKNLTWSFALYAPGDEDLEQAATGFPTEDAARRAYRGANPGGETVIPFEDERTANAYDMQALAFLNPRAYEAIITERTLTRNAEKLSPVIADLKVGQDVYVGWYLRLDQTAVTASEPGRVILDEDGDMAVRTREGTVVALLLGDGTMNPYVASVRRENSLPARWR